MKRCMWKSNTKTNQMGQQRETQAKGNPCLMKRKRRRKEKPRSEIHQTTSNVHRARSFHSDVTVAIRKVTWPRIVHNKMK